MFLKLNLTESTSTDFHIGSYSLNSFIEVLSNELSKLNTEKICIITDENIRDIYMNPIHKDSSFPLDEELFLQGYEVVNITLPVGEAAKTFESFTYILEILTENNFSKKDLIISFGGGSIGDISGLCASIYKRGLKLINIPTTLLSMIDSSLGGKNAINFSGIKNLLGSIYQPSSVIVNTDFLKTLSDKDIYSTWGEIVKYIELFSFLLKNYKEYLDDSLLNARNLLKHYKISTVDFDFTTLIYHCLLIKKIFVERDPLDKEIRQFLNFGHSIGHGVESLSEYKVPHGEAVLLGIYYAAKISHSLGILNKDEFKKFQSYLEGCNTKLILKYSMIELKNILQNDKKSSGGKINMILPHSKFILIKRELKIEDIIDIIFS